MADAIDYKIHGNDMQIVEIELDPGEAVQAEAGAMMFIEDGIEMMGGFKNALFGGEGLFLARLTGPGKVYLQGLPLSRLADRIVSASGSGSDRGEERGGLMGKLLGGD